jgi:hypothetical protein
MSRGRYRSCVLAMRLAEAADLDVDTRIAIMTPTFWNITYCFGCPELCAEVGDGMKG